MAFELWSEWCEGLGRGRKEERVPQARGQHRREGLKLRLPHIELCSWQVTSIPSGSSANWGTRKSYYIGPFQGCNQPLPITWVMWRVHHATGREALPHKNHEHCGATEPWHWLWALAFTGCVAWSNYFIALSLSFHIYKFKVLISGTEKTAAVKKSLHSEVRLPTLKFLLQYFLVVWLEQQNLPVPQFPHL